MKGEKLSLIDANSDTGVRVSERSCRMETDLMSLQERFFLNLDCPPISPQSYSTLIQTLSLCNDYRSQ